MSKNHCGEIAGCYKLIEKTNQKDTSGHFMYKCKCVFCEKVEIKNYRTLKQQEGKKCPHYDNMGFPPFPITNTNGKLINHIFNSMKRRCYDKNDASYRWYGEKGIKICDDWLYNPINFLHWSLKNGYKKGLSIDRIDANKDYCPENCQWILPADNSRKAGKVNWITIDEKTLTGRQWSVEIKKGKNFVNRYIRLYGLDKTISVIKSILYGELV